MLSPYNSTSDSNTSSSADGERTAMKCAYSILSETRENNLSELELLCKTAFSTGMECMSHSAMKTSGNRTISPYATQYATMLSRHDAAAATKAKKQERLSIGIDIGDFMSGRSLSTGMTESHQKNFARRFSSSDDSIGAKAPQPVGKLSKQSSMTAWTLVPKRTSFLVSMASMSIVEESRDYEDVIDPSILQASITDVCIVYKSDPVPAGYYRLNKSPTNKKANLNSGSGGNQIYLCLKKATTPEAVPITAFVIVFPDKNECIPPGYFVVRRDKHVCNINTGTSSERIFLCYKKDYTGNPITDIQIIFPNKNEECPKNFHMITKSASSMQANLNSGTGGGKIYLCYRQILSRLDCLMNDLAPTQVFRISESSSSSSSSGSNTHTISKKNNRGGLVTNGLVTNSNSKDNISSNISAHSSSDSISIDGMEFKQDTTDTICDDNQQKDSVSVVSSDAITDEKNVIDDSADIYDDELDIDNEHGNAERHVMGVDRKYQIVVDRNNSIAPVMSRRLLHVILSGLYTLASNIAATALLGLESLLTQSDFFENDLNATSHAGTISMLDITLECICDRFDLCIEAEYEKYMNFIRMFIRYTCGKVSVNNQHRLFKCFSFLCSYYSSRIKWVELQYPMPVVEPGVEITAFSVMKEMIARIVAVTEEDVVAAHLSDAIVDTTDYDGCTEAYTLCRSFAFELIESVMDCVEVSTISEAALLAISRQSSSMASFTFWHQVNVLSMRLFNESMPYRSTFISLCAICKLAWNPIRLSDDRSNKRTSASSKDIGSKLLALEALREFCTTAGERMRMSKIMGYQVRRLVIPCILQNLPYALCDERVFLKLVRLISSLWKNWRVHIRIEFATICEELIIKILQANGSKISPIYQMYVLQEVATWFDQPHLILEMFLNYDMDHKFVSHWSIFSRLVRVICDMAKKTSVIGVQEQLIQSSSKGSSSSSGSGVNNQSLSTLLPKDVHMRALEEVGHIAKTFMDATGHAYLISRDSSFRSRSLQGSAGWEDDMIINKASDNKTLSMNNNNTNSNTSSSSKSNNDSSINITNTTPNSSSSSSSSSSSDSVNTKKKKFGAQHRQDVHKQAEELMCKAVKIYRDKDSINKAILYLVDNGFMTNNPQEIASFLRIYKNSFDAASIGDFLGEGGKNKIEEEYWKQIRYRYTRAVSFHELEVEPALRLYLTGCGFRLPGEGQKIDRFVDVFSKAFWQDNHSTVYCPFRHSDTVHLLAYSIIILNTDLHKANNTKKKMKKMTKEEFINQLRGCDQGQNMPKEYLTRIYDNILSQPIELAVEQLDSSGSGSGVGGGGNDLPSSSPTPSTGIAGVLERNFIKEISRNIRDSDDLLRSLSLFTYNFQLTGVDANISLDLVSFMFESVCTHFYSIVSALLVDISSFNGDIYVIFAALDILSYSLCSSIFLGLKEEKVQLVQLLNAFKSTCEVGNHSMSAHGIGKITLSKYSDPDTWYRNVIMDDHEPYKAMEIVADVQKLIVLLKDRIQEFANYEVTTAVASRIEKKAKVLESNSYFVREGDLSKRNRKGTLDVYRFFLFSDVLYYAHLSMNGEYKVHGALPLSSMSVSSVSDSSDTSMYISHPSKSFTVICDTHDDKHQWLRDIQYAISSCVKRDSIIYEETATGSSRGRATSMMMRIQDDSDAIAKQTATAAATAASVAAASATAATNRISISRNSRSSNGNVDVDAAITSTDVLLSDILAEVNDTHAPELQ